jgi:16S rRNA (uracil1498-N3)-methyltransferase
MPRVLIPPDAVTGSTAAVTDPREVHHLLDVLRVKAGDRIECVDGAGCLYAGPILRCSRRGVVMEIRERFEDRAPSLRLALAQALIRPERFEWVIQKATELGVEAMTPLLTQRTVVRPAGPSLERRLARWQRIAREAAKQCGRATLPRIERPQGFREAVRSLDREAYVLMPTLSVPARSLKEELQGRACVNAAVVLIGPEGDFTPEEVALAQRHGARPVSLGRLTLRSETAAMATLAILQHVLS